MELTSELQEKKIFLIEGLKKTYKNQYDAIQPLPYVKDRLYCVDKVFVEGGIEVCLAPELTRGPGGSWKRLESYKSVYTDFRFKSKRRIIQGEPGYGKSTLTLQLAYDWCNDVWDSPMKNVEILILLRLRQLGRVKHLFGAIKSFLLSHEPRVSQHDIEKIINSCSSVHITLDGYDEYPGRDSNDNDDVHRIIKMELFADFDVSLTTRYLPDNLRQETKGAKLTGFDDKARDEYIRKAVVGNKDEAVEKIKQRLYENSILADLCQVPLIFVMFAHMAHDQRDVMKFKSVTQFFKHIIRCFYDHLNRKRKLNDRRHNRYLLVMEHHELDKIAFEGLNKRNQQLSWIKTEFRERVGPESYHQYILIGILVEEDVVSDDSTVDNVLFTTEVRFYHKLFCEWYAAHHLVTLVKNADDMEETLRFLDPFDLQYLFRFACGLDPDAGKKLINYLKSLPGGDTFAILCILEQTGDVKDIMDSVKDLCSRDVKIQEGDSALLQRSTTQLLEIASNNDIPISCLHLDYSSIKFEGDNIILDSGIPLPKLPTVEKIHIAGSNEQYGNPWTVTDNNVLNLFHYGMKCGRIKELMFSQLQLPTSVSPEAFTDIMKTQNIQVRWRPFDIDFHLDLQIGHWEVDDIQVILNETSGTVSLSDGNNILQDTSTLQLLEVAHNHDIPVSCLHLEYSSIEFEGDTIILHSGIPLPILPTVEKIHIDGSNTPNGNTGTLTDNDMLNLFQYGMKCGHVKEMMFDQFQLPTPSSSEAFTYIMKTKKIQVRWLPLDIEFHLDQQNGHWEVDDIQVILNKNSGTVSLSERNDILQETSTLQLLDIARNHDIPISCLHLEYSSIKFKGDTIILHSGIPLPILPTVEKIHIAASNTRYGYTGTLTDNDLLNWFQYGMKCGRVKELMFDQFQLPTPSSSEAFTYIMKTKKIQVRWRPLDIEFHLDQQNGHWEVDDIQVIRNETSGTVSLSERNNILQDTSTLQLLEVAHNHDIPVSCLHLKYSSIKFKGDTIKLHSGIPLPILPAVEKIHVDASNAQYANTGTLREKHDLNMYAYNNLYQRQLDEEYSSMDLFSEMENFDMLYDEYQYLGEHNALQVNPGPLKYFDILSMFRYGMKCGRVNELMFDQLQLPTSFPPEAFTDTMKTQNIQVSWRPFDIDFHLDQQNGHWEVDDIQVILNENSGTVSLSERNDILQDTSTLQLLEVARNHDIPMSCLHLEYSSIEFEGDTIILHSGIPLPILPTVEKIHIDGSNTPNGNTGTLTDNDMLNLFRYGMKCGRVKELMFDQFQLSTFSSSKAFTYIMKTKKIQVRWRPFDIEFHLDQQNGHWEVDNINTLRQLCSDTVYIRNSDEILKQMSTIILIRIASNHEIPISCLHLDYSYIKFEGDTIILRSGICLPILPTVEKLHIAGSNAKDDDTETYPGISYRRQYRRHDDAQSANQETLTENDILKLFRYGMKSRHIKKLMFGQLQLPNSISPEAITNKMKTRNIQVSWRPFNIDFHLDLQNGHWEVDDIQVILNETSGTVSLSERNNILQDTSTLQLLEVARNHDIPISCLHLEYSSIEFEGDTIILHSGIPLPILPTVEKIHIDGSNTRYYNRETLTDNDLLNWFQYGMKCGRVKELMFDQFQLSTFSSSKAFTYIMKTKKIQVRWRPFDIEFHLDQQNGHWEVDNIDTLRQLCSDTVYIKSDGILKQASTVMFIHIASSHEIPISCLNLYKSFRKIDAGDVILYSGLHLSCPVSVKKVVIHTEEGREMTETEVVDILMFVKQSHMLEELKFDGCLLPLTFSSESILSELQSRKIKVFWSNYGYSLDLQSGIWKVDDVDTVKRVCTENVNIFRHGSELLQRCTIKLLKNASYHDIPISCLDLKDSFREIDAGDVILHSGLHLSCPVSVKKVVINTGRRREMRETEVVDILMFVQKSHLLEELEFDGLLPSISSSEAILAEFKTRDIKVLWMNCGYSLNFQSGAWEVDVDTVKCICTEEVEISDDDSEFLQRCTIQLLENASAHDIPISCLFLWMSLSKIDAGKIILQSGLCLSCPVSVKKVVIYTGAGREMTETEVVDILMFVQQSYMLKELEFSGGELPLYIPAESIPSILKSRNVKVTWIYSTWSDYRSCTLNLQSGRWMDIETGEELTDTDYNDEFSMFWRE